jgi:hypothetical protein
VLSLQEKEKEEELCGAMAVLVFDLLTDRPPPAPPPPALLAGAARNIATLGHHLPNPFAAAAACVLGAACPVVAVELLDDSAQLLLAIAAGPDRRQWAPEVWGDFEPVRAGPGRSRRLSFSRILQSSTSVSSMAFFHGRANRLTALFGGARPGQSAADAAIGIFALSLRPPGCGQLGRIGAVGALRGVLLAGRAGEAGEAGVAPDEQLESWCLQALAQLALHKATRLLVAGDDALAGLLEAQCGPRRARRLAGGPK